MVNYLIGIHAALGEIGVFAFLWVFVEILNPTPQRISRARMASVLGIILLFLSWTIGGYYYVQYYGQNVKPLIKSGPLPWSHTIATETKEHVFMFIPFLAMVVYLLLRKYEKEILLDKKIRKAVLLLSGAIIILGFLMAGLGYLISNGARAALEASQ